MPLTCSRFQLRHDAGIRDADISGLLAFDFRRTPNDSRLSSSHAAESSYLELRGMFPPSPRSRRRDDSCAAPSSTAFQCRCRNDAGDDATR
jgi:hypothetical protein